MGLSILVTCAHSNSYSGSPFFDQSWLLSISLISFLMTYFSLQFPFLYNNCSFLVGTNGEKSSNDGLILDVNNTPIILLFLDWMKIYSPIILLLNLIDLINQVWCGKWHYSPKTIYHALKYLTCQPIIPFQTKRALAFLEQFS